MGIDPRKYGPTRGELKFRLVASALGLVLLAVTLALTGMPSGAAIFEIFGIAGVFLLGTLVWSARRLILRLHP